MADMKKTKVGIGGLSVVIHCTVIGEGRRESSPHSQEEVPDYTYRTTCNMGVSLHRGRPPGKRKTDKEKNEVRTLIFHKNFIILYYTSTPPLQQKRR